MTIIARFGQLSDAVIRRDINDNDTETIVVGNTAVDRRVHVEYTLDLPVSDRAQTGEIVIVQGAGGIDLDHHYSFDPPELDEVIFTVNISGTDIRLLIECIGLGENPTFLYRLTSIPVA